MRIFQRSKLINVDGIKLMIALNQNLIIFSRSGNFSYPRSVFSRFGNFTHSQSVSFPLMAKNCLIVAKLDFQRFWTQTLKDSGLSLSEILDPYYFSPSLRPSIATSAGKLIRLYATDVYFTRLLLMFVNKFMNVKNIANILEIEKISTHFTLIDVLFCTNRFA